MKTTKTSQYQRQPKTVTPVQAREGKRQRRGGRKAEVLEDLELIHLHAAGIDIGSAENMVCVPARSVGANQSNVRSFGVFTQEQDDQVEWLKDCGVTTVAMEATGIYWLTLYDKLESAGLEVLLVDRPRMVKMLMRLHGNRISISLPAVPASELGQSIPRSGSLAREIESHSLCLDGFFHRDNAQHSWIARGAGMPLRRKSFSTSTPL